MTSRTEARKKWLIDLVFGHGAVVFFALFIVAAFLWGYLRPWIRDHWHW